MTEPTEKQRLVTCAIDTETTNIDSMKAHAVEITILPLTEYYDIDTSKKHLTTLINPGIKALDEGAESLKFNKIPREDIISQGIPSIDFTPMLAKWMKENSIDMIVPLGHNYNPYDSVVMKTLMGFETYERMLYRRAKDSHTFAICINDIYAFKGLKRPFVKTSLQYLTEYFGIPSEGAHRSYKDSEMTAQVYKRLLSMVSIIL
jgi:DNA polymerase III epsilon subunit-like protein